VGRSGEWGDLGEGKEKGKERIKWGVEKIGGGEGIDGVCGECVERRDSEERAGKSVG
jgi:hypothetical protein